MTGGEWSEKTLHRLFGSVSELFQVIRIPRQQKEIDGATSDFCFLFHKMVVNSSLNNPSSKL